LCVAAIDDHGGRQGNTVRALARWQRPVAPSEALGMLYRAMRITLHRRICMAIKTASKLCVFFIIIN
jgi:hypothetical protein